MVQCLLKKDGRPNPFTNNRPGEKWWKVFKQRHPEFSLSQSEHLQLSHAWCCTPEAIHSWRCPSTNGSIWERFHYNTPLQIG